MKRKPIIFLAFANDQDAHLDLLKQESRGIFRALQDKGHLQIKREESISQS